jgi:hypothetical protein
MFITFGIVVAVAGWLALFRMGKRQDAARKLFKDDAQKRMASIPDFSATANFLSPSATYALAIDVMTERLAICTPEQGIIVIPFSKVLAAEIDVASYDITTTKGKVNMGGAAVATALVGPIGLGVGATTSSVARSASYVTNVSIRIFTDNIDSPVITVPFYEFGAALPEKHEFVVQAKREAEVWDGRLRALIARAGK